MSGQLLVQGRQTKKALNHIYSIRIIRMVEGRGDIYIKGEPYSSKEI